MGLSVGHLMDHISGGIGFDGIITCRNTKDKENKFIVSVLDDGKLNPSRCPACHAELITGECNLGPFQTNSSVDVEMALALGEALTK